jgi:hypothetical protein
MDRGVHNASKLAQQGFPLAIKLDVSMESDPEQWVAVHIEATGGF